MRYGENFAFLSVLSAPSAVKFFQLCFLEWPSSGEDQFTSGQDEDDRQDY